MEMEDSDNRSSKNATVTLKESEEDGDGVALYQTTGVRGSKVNCSEGELSLRLLYWLWPMRWLFSYRCSKMLAFVFLFWQCTKKQVLWPTRIGVSVLLVGQRPGVISDLWCFPAYITSAAV